MHDTFLFKRITDEVDRICKENNINKLTLLEVTVHTNSHVDKESLYEHLILEQSSLLDYSTNVVVNKKEIEELTAIINKVEGNTSEN